MAPPEPTAVSSLPMFSTFQSTNNNGINNPGHYVTHKWTIHNFNRLPSSNNNKQTAGEQQQPQTPAKRITITTKQTTGTTDTAAQPQEEQQRAPYYYHSSVSTTQHSPPNNTAAAAAANNNNTGARVQSTRARSKQQQQSNRWRPKSTHTFVPSLQNNTNMANGQNHSFHCQDDDNSSQQQQLKHYFVYPEFSAHPTDARYGVWQFLLIKPSPAPTPVKPPLSTTTTTTTRSIVEVEKPVKNSIIAKPLCFSAAKNAQTSSAAPPASNNNSSSALRPMGFVTSTLQALRYSSRTRQMTTKPAQHQRGAVAAASPIKPTLLPATPTTPPPPEYHFCIRPIKLPVSSVRLDFQLHFLSAHNGLPLREAPVRGSFSCMSGFSLVYQTGFTFQYHKADTEAITNRANATQQHFVPSQLCIIIEMHIMPALTDATLLMQRTWLAHPADYYLTGSDRDVRVPCSRQVLIDKSPFFEALLRPACDWGDANRDFWHFSGCRTEALRMVVRYLYTSTVDVLCSSNDVRTMCDGIKLADMLLLHELKDLLCAKVHTLLDTDPENILSVFESLFDDNYISASENDAAASAGGFGALVWHDEDLWNHTCERLCREAFYVVRSCAWVTLRAQKPLLAKNLRTLLWSRVGPSADLTLTTTNGLTPTTAIEPVAVECAAVLRRDVTPGNAISNWSSTLRSRTGVTPQRPKSTSFVPAAMSLTPITTLSPLTSLTPVTQIVESHQVVMPIVRTMSPTASSHVQINGLPPAAVSPIAAKRAPIAVTDEIDEYMYTHQQLSSRQHQHQHRQHQPSTGAVRREKSEGHKKFDTSFTMVAPINIIDSIYSTPLNQHRRQLKTTTPTASLFHTPPTTSSSSSGDDEILAEEQIINRKTFSPPTSTPVSIELAKKPVKEKVYAVTAPEVAFAASAPVLSSQPNKNQSLKKISASTQTSPQLRNNYSKRHEQPSRYRTVVQHSYEILTEDVKPTKQTKKTPEKPTKPGNTKRRMTMPIDASKMYDKNVSSKWSWSDAVAALLLSTTKNAPRQKALRAAPPKQHSEAIGQQQSPDDEPRNRQKHKPRPRKTRASTLIANLMCLPLVMMAERTTKTTTTTTMTTAATTNAMECNNDTALLLDSIVKKRHWSTAHRALTSAV